jgi:hypothetical protein
VRYIQPYGIPDLDAPYINGNPSIGLAGSIPPAQAFEHPMREIVHMILKSGLVPSEADLYQLLKAIRTQKVNFAIDTGTTNNLVCVFDPVLEAYNNGLVIRIRVSHTNTGPAVIDGGPGFTNIVRIDGSPLSAGDMSTGGIAKLVYIDGVFQLLNPNLAAAIERAIAAITGGGPPPTGGGNTTYITNQFNGFAGMQAWENAGTFDWTVPGGVLKVWLRLWAGGGPGVEWVQNGLFIKGGDGGYVEGLFPVVPGTLMRAVIGAGAPPPVSPTTGNISYNSTNWKNTFGQSSTFGPAAGPPLCSATGGRGCFPDPPGDTDPSPGQPGHGTGGMLSRANGIYGRGGGGQQSSDGVFDDYIECTGDAGAVILVF